MLKRLLAASLALAAAATCILAGQVGVVATTNGERYEGEITERPDDVTIRSHGVDTVLTRDRVASIQYSLYATRFEAAFAALKPDDVAGRIALAREAFDRHEYAMAMRAASAAVDINPLNRDARQLESLISTQLQLETQTAANTTRPTAGDDDAASDRAATRASNRRERLDQDQINRVRQHELCRGDHVRIQFRDNVRKRFVDAQPGMAYRAFAAREDVDQAMTILARGTPAMVDDIRIRNDPIGVQAFGRKIETALVQGCATSNCHGGNQAGDFRLVGGAPDPATMITNFYLVTQYVSKTNPDAKGIFTPSTIAMVDRGDAQKSLLYQYSLPRARASEKHPPVRNWDGLFRNDDDRLARDIVEWMEVDLARLRPDYGFTFALEDRTRPATQPATQATTQPTTKPSTGSIDANDRGAP